MEKNSEWMAGQRWVIYSQTTKFFLICRDNNNDGKPSANIGTGGFVQHNTEVFHLKVHTIQWVKDIENQGSILRF